MRWVTANRYYLKMALHTILASLDADVYNNYDTLGCLHKSDSEILPPKSGLDSVGLYTVC